MLAGISGIFSPKAPIDEYDAMNRARERIRLIGDGFCPWESHPPPRNETVECYRPSNGQSFEVVPRDLPAWFNISDLYWRPEREMKVIEHDL